MRTRAAGLGAVSVLLTALTGCGMSGSPAAEPTRQPSAGITVPASTMPGSFDPAHAVAAPGPLKLPMRSADLLVISPKTISDDDLAQIEAVKGVQATTTMSLAQVPIEDRAMVVASVDLAAYRRFTPVGTARYGPIWERVAGGEIAVSKSAQKTLPIGRDGYLRLGNTSDAPQLHVGAFAQQVPYIDMIVNQKWGEGLGMTPGNAVLISTGITAPGEIQEKLTSMLPKSWSIQGLDAAARNGIDLDASQTAVVVGSFADAVGTYTYRVIGGGRIAPDPAWVSSHIATEAVPILGSMTCNKAIFPQLKAALAEIVSNGLASQIHPNEYAGCFYPRFIAGTTTLSNHSFGLAFDINVPGNQRGTAGEINRAVVAIFKKWGFAWGGDWSYTDPMHFELARLVQPR